MWFPPFYKTINNVKIVLITFKRDTNFQFFHLGWYVGLKSDHIWKFKENSFSKDFGTGTLNTKIALISRNVTFKQPPSSEN